MPCGRLLLSMFVALSSLGLGCDRVKVLGADGLESEVAAAGAGAGALAAKLVAEVAEVAEGAEGVEPALFKAEKDGLTVRVERIDKGLVRVVMRAPATAPMAVLSSKRPAPLPQVLSRLKAGAIHIAVGGAEPRRGKPQGLVISDGVRVAKRGSGRAVLLVDDDRGRNIISIARYKERAGVRHALQTRAHLIDRGQALISKHPTPTKARSGLGLTADGSVIMVVVYAEASVEQEITSAETWQVTLDGSAGAKGIDSDELERMMSELGAVTALELAGGARVAADASLGARTVSIGALLGPGHRGRGVMNAVLVEPGQ